MENTVLENWISIFLFSIFHLENWTDERYTGSFLMYPQILIKKSNSKKWLTWILTAEQFVILFGFKCIFK